LAAVAVPAGTVSVEVGNLGQFKSVRERLSRALESGRASVSRARAQAGGPAAGAGGVAARTGNGRAKAAGGQDYGPTAIEVTAGDASDAGVPAAGGPPGRPIGRRRSRGDDRAVPDGLRAAAAWAWRLLILILAAWVALWVIAKLQVVVVPLAIALLLSALLSPAVGVLVRLRMPRSLATALVLVGGLALLAGTLTLVISQFIDGAPQLASKATAGLNQIQDSLKRGPLHLSDQQLKDINSAITGWFTDSNGSWASGLFSTASTVGRVLTSVFLVLFATFFFLRDGRKISRFLFGLLPRPVRGHILSAADASWSTLVSYVRATVLVAFIDAVGIGIALVVLGVPFPFALAALVFLGAFVPIVGATVSGALAVLVAFVDQGLVVALILLAWVIAVQQFEGHVLQPVIMGRAVAIHPLAVIVAIATGIVLAGIVGALVAVPIVAVLNTGIRHLAEIRRARDQGDEPGPTSPTGPPMPGGWEAGVAAVPEAESLA
jgi:predicted PurR-regulated permease PerM